MKYDPHAIEQRWQQHWNQHKTYRTPNPGDPAFDADKPKYYVLAMFPYPSGAGMHLGHALNYTSTDIIARYKRMQGHNVLHPIGFDSFGLPAEQYAVEHNVHPRTTTEQNIEIISKQLQQLGLSFDWDRNLATTDPEYYKWTQWVFLKLYNSWFDLTQNAARPISELEQWLESGDAEIGPDGDLVYEGAMFGLESVSGGYPGNFRWYDLSPEQQRALLDEYRLAYIDEVPVNWCPALGTVLANEEVTAEGRSERGNHPVYKRPLKQWMLRITAFADRLLEDLDLVDWPEPIKLMQRNWIGKSQGAEVSFPLAHGTAETAEESITVFTTRPDTLFGATYMVLAPEHPLVELITTAEQLHDVNEYRKLAAARSDVDRQAESDQKTGVFTGAYALNPVNDATIPIWIADYVLMGYGTGAIMAVPAHDERDFAFARAYELSIKPVLMPSDHWLKEHAPASMGDAPIQKLREHYPYHAQTFAEAYTGHGTGIHSSNEEVSLNDEPTEQAKQLITQWLEQRSIGRRQTQYRLRDWLFSRQRYWGEPFPMLHDPQGRVIPLETSELPVELPEMEDFRPTPSQSPDEPPQPPLSRASDAWKYVERDGLRCTREFNTMPQWAGSCWYYLRFLDPGNAQRFVDDEAERYWMGPSEANEAGGVDMYIGGVEHAVLHLLYARFWHKVLYDLGYVSTPEPFGKLYNQGYIQAYAYTDQRGVYVPADQVEQRDGHYVYQGQPVSQEFGKMGKSLKNSVTPDDVIAEYGADALRLYLMYLGPLDQSKVWRGQEIVGVHRFLQRLWRNVIDEQSGQLRVSDEPPSDELQRMLHKTIRRATDAMEQLSFNIAIAALIELNNELVSMQQVPRQVAEAMVRLLAPLAPHTAEELWYKLGHEPSVADAAWPAYDADKLIEDTIELPVQINGKVRSRIQVAADADQQAVEQIARADEKVLAALDGKQIQKVIVVPGRMVNIVAG